MICVHTQDDTRSHTRRYTFTHKMALSLTLTHIHTHTYTHTHTYIHTQDDTYTHKMTHTHTRWHVHKQDDTFIWKCCTVLCHSKFCSFSVINKQGTVFLNLGQILPHIMPFSIKHFQFPSVSVIHSMVYNVSALLSCFQYWVNFSLNDICTLGWGSKDSWL
jgi:hypothetical protein